MCVSAHSRGLVALNKTTTHVSVVVDVPGRAGNVRTADMDGDGDKDIVVASYSASMIRLHRKVAHGFTSEVVYEKADLNPFGCHVEDMDGDGDMDILSAGFNDHSFRLHRNVDGKAESFETLLFHSALQAESVHAWDMDNDGDMDIITGSHQHGEIHVHLNIDGKATNFKHVLVFSPAPYLHMVNHADMDGDGYMDVISASAGDNSYRWHR